ncbi:MAG: DUF512 domain-containing protein [Bacillota bacterium]
MIQNGLPVEKVAAGGIAHQLGVEPGDRIVEINGQPVRDIVDYRFLSCGEKLNILVVKPGGESWLLDIEKDYEDSLGLEFGPRELGRIKRCRNRCIFCFLDQMPRGLRSTLYFNDDDYRLSFTQGNFITLTNVRREDLERIAGQRLSPLYISVHTTNPVLREKMLNNPRAGKIMEQLRFLAGAGIEMHAQAVLCPGINDGPELARTISDLYSLWPAVRSLAAVPVGLTRYRDKLYPLRIYNKEEAREITGLIRKWQRACRRRGGRPFVFAADEFYLLAGEPVPPAKDYAGFPQLENGVGLVRLFWDEWAAAAKKLPAGLARPRKVTVATGKLGEEILKPVVGRLNEIENLEVQLIGVTNRFFGETVTVAGLLTAQDLLAGLAGRKLGDLLIIPAVMLREKDDVFLDGLTLPELARRLGVPAAKAGGPRELCRLALND